MFGFDYRAARCTWTVVATLILLAIIYRARQTLFVFVLALLFAYLLWPLVDYLDQLLPGRSRTPALVIVYSLLIVVLLILGTEIGSHAAREANGLAGTIPEFIARMRHPAAHGMLMRAGSLGNLTVWASSLLSKYSKNIVSLLPKAGLKLLSVGESLIFLVLVPILSFFFLKDGRAMRNSALSLIGNGDASRRDLLEGLARDLNVLLVQYMRALVILAGIAFAAYGLFLALMRVHYAILLAALSGPLEFIPVVGPVVAFVIIMLVSGLSGSNHLIWIAILLIGFRIVQDYFIAPRIMSKQMEIHPLLVIFGVLAGGEVAGIAGAFLSVPVLATLHIVYLHLVRRRIQIPDSDLVWKI
jgi:predicted PurR-regulated permease PerM